MNFELIKILGIIFIPIVAVLFLYCMIIKSTAKQPHHIFICHVVAATISIFIFNWLGNLNKQFIDPAIISNNIDSLGILKHIITKFRVDAKGQELINIINNNIPSAIKIIISLFNILCSIAGAVGLSSTDKRKSNISIFIRVILFEIIGVGLLIGLVIISK